MSPILLKTFKYINKKGPRKVTFVHSVTGCVNDLLSDLGVITAVKQSD